MNKILATDTPIGFVIGWILFCGAAILTAISARMLSGRTANIHYGYFESFTLRHILLFGAFSILIVGIMFSFLAQRQSKYVFPVFWGTLFVVVAWNLFFGLFSFRTYGDTGYLPMVVETGLPFSRWLGGSAVLVWIYSFVKAVIPNSLSAPEFVKLSGCLAMVLASILLLHHNTNRLAIILSVFSPVWLLFSSGYDEYYPFIAGIYLFSLDMIYDEKTPSSYWYAVLVALLPLMYIGFAPLSLILIAKYSVRFPKKIFSLLCVSVVLYLLGVEVFWPGGFTDYMSQLYLDLNLGEKNMLFDAYKGLSASPLSLFFSQGYALSSEHFRDLIYMQFWGGGWITPALLFLLIPAAMTMHPGFTFGTLLIWAKSHFFIGLFFMWQAYYFVFMIPKLGPSRDVDLFFTFYILVAFVAGLLADKALLNRESEHRVRFYILSMVAGSHSIILSTLLFSGI